MTTPPPVGTGEEGADAEAAAPAAPAPAFQQTYDSFMQTNHDTKKDANKKKHSGVSINTLRKALEKMVSAVWVDPQSKKALHVVHGLLQEQVSTDPAAEEATAAPTVEVSQEAFQGMQENT